MPANYFFYDLETSGFDPKSARIMQFAGQRVDAGLSPIGEPVNILLKLTPDVLPDPDAVLVTGITPQATIADGITEAEFLKVFERDICQPETTFVGYNSVRFDDEFMRYLLYRNFCDAYEWQWCDGCSRWDLLDVVRMTRALRPAGITWPFATDGSPSNRLEYLTQVNGLDHENAHDALSDVWATIDVARLIKAKQPKLFEFLYGMRDKRKVAAVVDAGQPFVYTSGAYPPEYEKTTVATRLAPLSNHQGALVFDLRHDPTQFVDLTVKELTKLMTWQPRKAKHEPFPVKALRYNRCPAIAPISVLDAASQKRLRIDMTAAEKHRRVLESNPDFATRVSEAYASQAMRPEQSALMGNEHQVDSQLYDGFLNENDKKGLKQVRRAIPDELSNFAGKFHDNRLNALLPLYKARNYPDVLSSTERLTWETFCAKRLLDGGQKSRLAKYFERLQILIDGSPAAEQQYLLEELKLYGESIMPAEL